MMNKNAKEPSKMRGGVIAALANERKLPRGADIDLAERNWQLKT